MRIESLRDLLNQFPDIDHFWNFDDYLQTEGVIRQLLPKEERDWAPSNIENLTQLARVQGLQFKLSEAGSTLLQIQEIMLKNENQISDRAKIRFNIEQGRFFALSMSSVQSLKHFSKAWDLAQQSNDNFFSIEAALMLSISQPPKYQNEWLQKALAFAENTKDENAKLWLPQLYIMNGWHCFDFRKFEEALINFKKASEQPQLDPKSAFTIKWCLARTMRTLNQVNEALAIQQELLKELTASNTTNGHVYLEIAECFQLLKQPVEAKTFFELAYKELSLNGWYTDNKPSELSRIQYLAKKKY